MKNPYNRGPLLPLFFLAALLTLVACPTSDEPARVLNMQIDKDNDSLLTFDSLIVKVYSKDSSFSQEVFHGVLRDPKQVSSMPLDPRVGKEYTVSIIGYKGGKVGVNKQVIILAVGNYQSKDLPIKIDKPETVIVIPDLPEILAPTDTNITEGDSLRFRITVRNPWSNPTTLTLKEAITGAALDTVGRDAGDGYFTWRPTFEQGRAETYAVTFVYAMADKKVEKITRVKVMNTNRPPKLAVIADQKAKENETLSFRVEASDPDHDSLTLTAADLPTGAAFTGNTFTWKPSEGQANNYSVKFKVFDGSDSDQVAVLITVGNVDAPPPVRVEITSPAHDTTINFTPITILYTVNGALLQKKYALISGKNRIRVDTTILGRTGFDTVLITLDTVPPGAPIVSGASPVRTRTPSWTWVSGGNGGSMYRYRLDNEDMTGATLLTETAYTASKDLDVGAHTLFVQERDAAGNWSPSGKRAVRIDTTRPAAPVVSVSPTSPTNNPLPTWSWNAGGDDLSGLYRYKLDTNDFRAGAVETKAATFTPDKALKEGLHALYIQVQDSAGNWSTSAGASLVLDLTPPGKPKVTVATTSPTNNARPTWNIVTGDGTGLYRAKLDDTNLTLGANSGTFSTFTPDSALAHGTHTLYVQERDSAGNWSASQSAAIRVDLMPPEAVVFDATPRSPLNSLLPTWTWKSGGGMGTYRYKLDDSTLSQGGDTLKVPSFKPGADLTESLHTLYVQERDSAGNWSSPAAKALTLSVRGTVGNAGFSPGGADAPSLALSEAGKLFVAFTDGAYGYKATVMRFNGSSWQAVGNAGFTDSAAFDPSLAVNSAGIPYVAFQDYAHGDKTTVMRFNGTQWETVGSAGFSEGPAYSSSLAFSPNGTPYIAFRDAVNSNKATVMRLNGTAWETVGSARFSEGEVFKPSLKISVTGTPYLAFQDVANGKKAMVMRYNGVSWEKVGKTEISTEAAFGPSLALSSTGAPYLAFLDVANNGKATVMRFNGSIWESVGRMGFSTDAIYMPSLALSATDVPYLAFQDGLNGSNKATVMRFNGTVWETVGPAAFSNGPVSNVSLVLDKGSVPYVAFSDGTDGQKATVMKTSFDP